MNESDSYRKASRVYWAASIAAALLVLACCLAGVFYALPAIVLHRPPMTSPAAGDPMPANEAQARQNVVDFYQKTLQQLPEDWYWSSTFPNGHDVMDEGSSYGLNGTTWKFRTSFWLRSAVVDSSEEPEHAHPFFDRVISVWERIGWSKTSDETDPDGTRFVNGHTDTGLEISLQISKIGGIGSMCQARYPRTGTGADRPNNTFPRLITRNGPAPWTPPNN